MNCIRECFTRASCEGREGGNGGREGRERREGREEWEEREVRKGKEGGGGGEVVWCQREGELLPFSVAPCAGEGC